MARRFQLLILTAIVLVGMTSCAAKGPPAVETLPHEPARMAIAMAPLPAGSSICPAEPGPSDSGVTMLYWLAPSAWQNLDPVLAAFEAQNPGIRVQLFRTAAGDDRFDVIAQKLLAPGCATVDLLSVEAVHSAYYAAYGWLSPLWNQFTFDEKEDWIQALRKSGRYNQELYSAPISTSTSLLFYNADLFDRAGLTQPGAGERLTWEKLVELAKKLTLDENKDGIPEVWGFAWEDASTYQLLPLAESLGGEAMGEDGLTVKGVIDTQPWIDALAFYGKIFNEWKVSPKTGGFNGAQAFAEGKLAMFVGRATNIDRFTQAGIYWGVSRYPYFQKGKVVVPTGDWQVAVNARTAHQAEAMTFLAWLATKPGGEALWRAGNATLPAEKTALALFDPAPELANPPRSYWKTAASEALIFTLPEPITPFYEAYETTLQRTFKEIREGADPKISLAQAAEELASAMK